MKCTRCSAVFHQASRRGGKDPGACLLRDGAITKPPAWQRGCGGGHRGCNSRGDRLCPATLPQPRSRLADAQQLPVPLAAWLGSPSVRVRWGQTPSF